jgi:thymidylate synthase (FAD)
MLAVLRRMLAGETVTQAESGMGKRDWTEFLAAIGRDH